MKTKLLFVSATVTVLLAIQILLLPQLAYAGTCISNQSGDWGVTSNWDCGHVPNSGDDVVISATHTIAITAAATAQSLTINSDGTLNSLANTLTVSNNGAFTNNAGGTFNAGTGKVSFAGSGTVAGTVTFNDVTVAGGVDFGSGSTVNGTLQIDSGGSIVTNAPTYGSSSGLIYNTGGVFVAADEWMPGVSSGQGVPQDVQISNNTTLNLGSATRTATGNLIIDGGSVFNSTTGNLNIGGNLTNNGAFTHNNGTVTFNGSGAQSIFGVSVFYNLTIDNKTATPNDGTDVDPTAALTVLNTLTVNDGQFQPANGSSFKDVVINSSGSLKPDNAANLTVSGNWTNNSGVFTHNNGTVTFNNAGTQIFSGSAIFNHVAVNGGSTLRLAASANFGYAGTFTLGGIFDVTTNSPTTVRIAGTTPQTLPAGVSTLRNLTINSGASLTAPAGTLNIAGNWTKNGDFSHNNSTVTFNGSGGQTINGGTTTFYNLVINNSTGVTLNSNIRINNTLIINAGRILNGGSRTLTFTGGGSFTNNGTFNQGNSTVLFTGTGAVTGIVTFYNVTLRGAVDLGPSSTVNGTLQLDSGGVVSTNVPTYSNTSTLRYNTTGSPIAATEWTSNTTSGQGVPQNVRISNNTALNLGGSNRTARGNLIIDSGSVLNSTTGNLNIGGNWTNNGNFNHNNGVVTFNGSGAQAITAGSTIFNKLFIDTASPGLTLNSGITVSNTLTISPSKVFNGGSQTLIMLDGSAFENVGGTFNAGSSTVRFDGVGTITSAGTITYNNVILNGAGGVDFGITSIVDGILQINTGGSVDTNSPTYSSSSTLLYNTGGTFIAATEWISNTTSNPGVPQNVRISNNTTLNLGGGDWTARGNLTIDSGSTLNSTGGNLNIGGNWINDGAFNPNNGIVIFNGAGAQAISGNTAPVFYNLTISNTAVAPDDTTDVDPTAAITVTNMLTVNDGQFQPHTGSLFKDITIINNNGILKPDSGAGITVSGNWINNGDNFIHNGGTVFFNGVTTISGSNDISFNHVVISNTYILTGHNLNMNIAGDLTKNGTFNHNNGTVTFNGSGAQAISGSNFVFYNLTVDNTAPTPGDTVDVDPISAITVQNNLVVNDGQFQPYYLSRFKHVTINTNGILNPDGPGAGGAGAIYVSGNWTNNGAFIHNNGFVIFDGTTTISGTVVTTFYNLYVTNNANVDTSTAIAVKNELKIFNGQLQPSTGSSFNHIDIFNPSGTLTPKGGAVFSVSGHWANYGAFNSNNSSIIFNGIAPQSVSGQAIIFNSVAISNAAGVTLGIGVSVTITNTLTLSSGVLSNNATDNIILNDGATISRAAGSLAVAPQFGTTVNVEYTGSTGVNTGHELPISSTILNNLTSNNSGGVTLIQNATVNGAFTLNASTFNINTNTLTLKGPAFATGGSLVSAATGTVIYDQQSNGQNVLPGNYGHLTFTGAFTKTLPSSGVVVIAGTFNPDCSAAGHTVTGSTIEYNGASPQTLPPCFNPYYNLTLNNLAGVVDFAGLTVNNLFRVKSGPATLTGSGTYNHMQIDSGATMAINTSNAISISGNLTNNGSFSPNSSDIIFNGNSSVSGANPISFYNVTIANTAQLTGHVLNMNIAGNFINNGAYNHNNGSVTFNGAATQFLTANTNTIFNNLIVVSGAILSETLTTDNAFVAGTLTNNGLIRKSKPVSLGTNTFGLTGITLTVTTLGSLSNIQIDRTGANHSNAPSALQTGEYWRFSLAATGYTVDLALPHTIADDTDATICRYTGSDTTWNCARDSSTATSVTRTGINELLSDWAIGNYDLADLQLIKKVNNADWTTANKDDTITYTITVNNLDPSLVTGVKVIDLLPTGNVTFVSSETTHGSYDDNNGEWNFTNLAGNESAILTLTVTVDVTVTTPITNTAQITTADQRDDNTGNNQDIAVIKDQIETYLPVIMKGS